MVVFLEFLLFTRNLVGHYSSILPLSTLSAGPQLAAQEARPRHLVGLDSCDLLSLKSLPKLSPKRPEASQIFKE